MMTISFLLVKQISMIFFQFERTFDVVSLVLTNVCYYSKCGIIKTLSVLKKKHLIRLLFVVPKDTVQ